MDNKYALHRKHTDPHYIQYCPPDPAWSSSIKRGPQFNLPALALPVYVYVQLTLSYYERPLKGRRFMPVNRRLLAEPSANGYDMLAIDEGQSGPRVYYTRQEQAQWLADRRMRKTLDWSMRYARGLHSPELGLRNNRYRLGSAAGNIVDVDIQSKHRCRGTALGS